MYSFELKTEKQCFIDITKKVQQAVNESGIKSGICIVYCPHTTAGITINENADPSVKADMIFWLSKVYPDCKEFKHIEGNSAAHIKASVIGTEKTIIIENGKLILGMWQGIYFCEFDGPRQRKFLVKIL